MKHTGSFEDLQTIVKGAGYTIIDADDTGQTSQIRTEEGAILNWFQTTGTVQFQDQKGRKGAGEKLRERITEYLGKPAKTIETAAGQSSFSPVAQSDPKTKNRKVFVVHGHDSPAREQLELILHKLGLDPFILQNTGGGGLTIIEALEKEVGHQPDAARFGIVLLTPDDIGYAKAAGDKEGQPRARQNVVFEMGMLIAALKRPNVAILKKGHIEVPSDAQGILYISFNDHIRETVPKLVDRLRAAGFVLNPEAITRASS